MLTIRTALICILFSIISFAKSITQVQEIWRTLVLPKGTFSENLDYLIGDVLYSSDINEFYMDYNSPGSSGNATLYYPEYSLTDKISLAAFPLPFVNILLMRSPLIVNDSTHSKAFQVAVKGGMQYVNYNWNKKEWCINTLVGLDLKKPLTERVWYWGNIGYEYGIVHSEYSKFNVTNAHFSSGSGFQVSQRNDIQVGYSGIFSNVDFAYDIDPFVPSDLISTVSLTWHCNFNENLSFWASTGATFYRDMISQPLNTGVQFRW